MRKMIVFGTSEIAELVKFYFESAGSYKVCGFTLNEEYIAEEKFLGLDIVPFETLLHTHPSSDYDVFIGLSYSNQNKTRKAKYSEAKEMGYTLPSYISPKATILNDHAFGDNCLILEDNTIQPKVIVGNNVTLWSGNHIGHHSIIGNHVFISSHVVVSGGVRIEDSVFVGVNAAIRDHINIGESTVIGAGSIIMKSTDPNSTYVPNRTNPR